MEIYFRFDKEVISFCEYLFRYNKQIELSWRDDTAWGNRLQLADETLEQQAFISIADAMADVFMIHRLTDMVDTILRENYHYSDTEEIEHILNLTYWIFFGIDQDSRLIRNHQDPVPLLRSIFYDNLSHSSSTHYDSIVQFRLQTFEDRLIYYVGQAIDEYKREEDHQAFLNMLREFIAQKDIKQDVVHVLQGTPFRFFKENGVPYRTRELNVLMEKEPLYLVGLDAQEKNLAPLIAMAPKYIKIYGNHPSDAKTLTIINVFEEKVELLPMAKFPFMLPKSH